MHTLNKPETVLQEILDADVLLTMDTKTTETCQRFHYKLNPLPVHTTLKKKKEKAKREDDCYCMKVDGCGIVNAMSAAVHPLFSKIADLKPQDLEFTDPLNHLGPR